MSNVLLNFCAYETIPVSASATSNSGKFKLPQSMTQPDCMVYNAGSVDVFVCFGPGSATAVVPTSAGTEFGTPIPPGATMCLSKNRKDGTDTCAVITATGTSNVYFTSGAGN